MELVVISGKGGTGKTTVAAALAHLAADSPTIVDADVDAPNLHLMFPGNYNWREPFSGSKSAVVDPGRCVRCGRCNQVCRFDAISCGQVQPLSCEGCGACLIACPQRAITLAEQQTAEVFFRTASSGRISYARMEIGADGSGRLVTKLRNNARDRSRPEQLVIVDGSPGIGCAVISSIAGSDSVLIVTEPTQSGFADMIRVVELCTFFGLHCWICINKCDLNEKVTIDMVTYCQEKGLNIMGQIPFDPLVSRSINELKPIVYYPESAANKEIRRMWSKIKTELKKGRLT